MSSTSTVAPGRGSLWRPRTKSESDPLRCATLGLPWGDCSQHPVEGSVYCYYHDKVLREVLTWFVDHRNREVPASHYYLVYPLPKGGYVLLYKEQDDAVQ